MQVGRKIDFQSQSHLRCNDWRVEEALSTAPRKEEEQLEAQVTSKTVCTYQCLVMFSPDRMSSMVRANTDRTLTLSNLRGTQTHGIAAI